MTIAEGVFATNPENYSGATSAETDGKQGIWKCKPTTTIGGFAAKVASIRDGSDGKGVWGVNADSETMMTPQQYIGFLRMMMPSLTRNQYIRRLVQYGLERDAAERIVDSVIYRESVE